MIAVMALVTAAVFSFPTTESTNLYCEQALRSDSGGKVIANLVIEAARDGTFIGSTLTAYRPSFKVSWRITKPLLDRATPVVSMEMDDVGLPRDTTFPVTVSLLIDGSKTWRRDYAAATSTIIDTDAMIHAGLPVRNALAFGHPGISPEVEAAGLTTLFGARQAQITSTGGGVVIAVKPLDLPDWSALASFTARAFVALQADRARGACQPRTEIIVS